MTTETDNTAERLARIDARLAQTKGTIARTPTTDRILMRELSSQLNKMLKELRSPYDVRT